MAGLGIGHHGGPTESDEKIAEKLMEEYAMAAGTIRYWAAAKAAAGVAEEPYAADTLAQALDVARDKHPGELVQVLRRCSFLVDGDPVGTRGHETVRLAEGGTVEVLPPFAGG